MGDKYVTFTGGDVKREKALSEVIGFLMIVSLLGILFSMYLLYVVPIQGRDAEISHMKYITQEFIGLKADIDGLIINNKINMPIARSFELGTLSSVGSGALSVMPLSSYIEASGLLMVNEQNDFLAVTINGSAVNLSNLPPIVIPPISNPVLEVRCNSRYDCFPIAFPNPKCISDRCYNFTIKERFSVNNTPGRVSLTNPVFAVPTPTVPAVGTSLNLSNFSAEISFLEMFPHYDLVLETLANNVQRTFIAEKTVIENLSFGRNYTYNFLKDNDIFPNNTSDYFLINPEEKLPEDLYSYVSLTSRIPDPPRIGSLKYESNNRYWINQHLLYEMGGLFLSQPSDQGSSVMLVPSIALTPVQNVSDPDEYILKVRINNIRITDTEDISGSVSAQIYTKVDNILHNVIKSTTDIRSGSGTPSFYKIRPADKPNAHAIWLQFIPDDSSDEQMRTSSILWKRGFDQIKTLTNKTLSENPGVGGYSDWIYSFRIEGGIQRYSSNLVIGKYARQNLDNPTACAPVTYPDRADQCLQKIYDYMENPGEEPFILDYTESELSLVMQSGAL